MSVRLTKFTTVLTAAVLMVGGLTGSRATAQDAPTNGPAPATAAPTAPADAAKVDALLKQLADPDGAARRSAADALVAMGAGAKPAVEQFLKGSADRKVKNRAEAVLTRIDNAALATGAAAAAPVALGGTPVTIDLTDVDAADAFDALFAQVKGEYGTFPPNLLQNTDDIAPVTLKYDKAPFWTVLRDLCKQTGLALQNSGDGSSRMMFNLAQNSDPDWLTCPSVVSNGFLISARTVSFSQSINLGRPERPNSNLSVQFYAYAEPSLRVVRSQYQITLDEATDDEGNAIAPKHDRNSSTGWSGGRQAVWNFQAPLNAAAATGNKITSLKGSAKFGVIAEAVRIEVPDAMNVKDFTKQVGAARVTIKDVKKQDGGGGNNEWYTVRVAMTRPRGGGDGNEMANLGPQGLRVLDAQGRELSNQGYNGGGSGPNGYEYQMIIGRYNHHGGGGESRPGTPAKIVWDIPTKVVDVTVPFEFKDLPLP